MIKIITWILVLGVLGLGAYYFTSKNEYVREEVQNNQEKTEMVQEKPESKKMAFSEFVKQEGSYKCEVKQTGDFGSTGEVLLNNGNIRGDFLSIAEGIEVSSSVIVKSGFTYVWSDLFPQAAIKVANVPKEEISTNTGMSGVYVWDSEQIGEYNCEVWTIEESKFELPKNITFKLIK